MKKESAVEHPGQYNKRWESRKIRIWGITISLGLCLLLLALALFISMSRADIANFASYQQYNNLSMEDTQAGPSTNTVNGTYTIHQLILIKYAINRRMDPSGTNWADTTAIVAVANDTIEFRITWQDSGTGGTADTVSLVDYLPSNMTFIDSQIVWGGGKIIYTAPQVYWVKNDVSPGETGDIRFRARVNP